MKFVIGICIFMLSIRVTKSEVSSSLSPSMSCYTIIYDMIDCVSYLSGDSTEEKPTPACCSGFEMVLKINVECFCEALDELDVDVNLTKAATLPSACQVLTAPPPTECNLAANPSSSESPFPNSVQTPTVPGSSETPAPSAPAEEVAKHAPSPVLSGTYILSSCFFALLSMLVISFSYISV